MHMAEKIITMLMGMVMVVVIVIGQVNVRVIVAVMGAVLVLTMLMVIAKVNVGDAVILIRVKIIEFLWEDVGRRLEDVGYDWVFVGRRCLQQKELEFFIFSYFETTSSHKNPIITHVFQTSSNVFPVKHKVFIKLDGDHAPDWDLTGGTSSSCSWHRPPIINCCLFPILVGNNASFRNVFVSNARRLPYVP